eukprot:4235869-Amphidinium_carterae.1
MQVTTSGMMGTVSNFPTINKSSLDPSASDKTDTAAGSPKVVKHAVTDATVFFTNHCNHADPPRKPGTAATAE